MILFRYVAWKTLGAFLGALVGVLAVFLAVDFVDNAPQLTGAGWIWPALELYANKSAVVVRQIAPAAMILGAAIAASGLRQTREWVALRALGLGPWRLAVPIMAVMLVAGLVLVVVHEAVGVHAADRAEEIRAERFGRKQDIRRREANRAPKRWFRGASGQRIYHLRGNLPGGGFENVTIYEVTPDFRLARRIDAERMRPVDGAWTLDEAEERSFQPDGTVTLVHDAERRIVLDEPPEAFAIAPGRPTQMRFPALVHQIGVRKRAGLPYADFEMERYNRIAYPFSGVPGAILALALALRRNRKGHVAAALLESVAVSLAFWSVQGVTVALALSGRVPAWVAAWAPHLIFFAAGVLAVRRSA
ncbi:MAG: LptF/LptG family permease [Anaeromyxobacteraceae bacterium]